jgi:hypothetical protein
MRSQERLESPPDGAEIARSILAGLASSGYVHVPRHLSLEDFEGVSSLLGDVAARHHIRVDPELERTQQATRRIKDRPSAYRAEALGLHSDNPGVAILAWYCVDQDDRGGESWLLDTADLPMFFTSDQLAALSGVRLRYSLRFLDTEEERFAYEPLLRRDAAGWAVYYQPWLRGEVDLPAQAALMAKFADYVEGKSSGGDLIRIRLEPSESLYIDNHRILHGRGEIAPTGRRHLIRLFLLNPGLRGDDRSLAAPGGIPGRREDRSGV